jgi:predicted nuclease of restriction endonuclease-like (RecB) superfamily
MKLDEKRICNSSINYTRQEMLQKSKNELGAMYRLLVKHQRSQPIDEQWWYGEKLKFIKRFWMLADEVESSYRH